MQAPAGQLAPTFDYFPHDADMGIVGRGRTVEAAFEAAARAMFGLMHGGELTHAVEQREVAFEEAELDYALVTWLNLLLAEARTDGLVFGRFELHRDGARWSGKAWGQPWRAGVEPGTEVKGATLTMLRVAPVDAGWEARCVVDV